MNIVHGTSRFRFMPMWFLKIISALLITTLFKDRKGGSLGTILGRFMATVTSNYKELKALILVGVNGAL